MGERLVIHVKNSPASLYMHFGGELGLEETLIKAIPKMRFGDPGYSLARLIGHACELCPGRNTGVGVLPPPKPDDPSFSWDEYSHGDAGVVVYDCATGETELYAGYFAEEHGSRLQLDPSPETFWREPAVEAPVAKDGTHD